jgi:hypothetical protein
MPGTTDTVKAILTPGEFVIRKEAVDMIGAPMLNMINNMPEKGGHSNIDSLIEKATMANMKGMYGGGMVQAGPKPMGTGGMVDAYRGGGMVMDQYGHGGKVKKNLKPVPKNNPGLGKLPESVRNKMGYMQNGGEVEKMQGYQNGGLSTLLSMISPKRRRQMDYKAMVPQDMQRSLEETEPKELRDVKEIEAINRLVEERDRIDALNKFLYGIVPQALGEQGTVAESVPLPTADAETYYKSIAGFYNPDMYFTYEDQLDRAKRAYEKKQQGGLIGYENGGMIGPLLPPEMMGQAMNQRLSDSIDMRMQNPQAGEIGIAREQASALQDSINMNTVDSARKSLQLIKLQSLLNNPDMSTQQFTQGEFAVPSEEVDLITKMVSMSRDAANARALDMMRMSMGSMSQPRDSMNGKVIEYMPYYSK